MAAPKRNSKTTAQTTRTDLTEVAQGIAHDLQLGNATTQKITLRHLLQRCGYERRSDQTVRRVAAALDSVGIQCLPPPAGVTRLDDTIQLQCAAPRKSGSSNGSAKTPPAQKISKTSKTTFSNASPSQNSKSKKHTFSSLEDMLLHARRATVLIKLKDGHGSGLVIDSTGLVLTARHVVEGSDTVCIRYEDGTEGEGRVLFSDVALDYAFVQCDAHDTFFTLHNEMHLSVGQPVYAVGTPLQADLAGSVSRGIISGLDRIIGGVNYIQTDATIHAGHSGGPLVNKDGDVIGLNLWGRPEEGIRFALPMSYVLEALQVLQPQLNDLDARLYCADCGFLNGADSWIICSSWVCCGHCGTVLGDLKAHEAHDKTNCEKTEFEELQADRALFEPETMESEGSKYATV